MAVKDDFDNFICKNNTKSREFCNQNILQMPKDTHGHDKPDIHTDQKKWNKQISNEEKFDETG